MMGTVHKLREDFDDKLEAAYNRVRDEVDAARLKADAFMGPCSECRFYRHYNGMMYFPGSDYCQHPLIQTHEFNEQSGKIESRSFPLFSPWTVTGGVRRKVPDLCGETRRLWEPRPTFWQRLWTWLLAPWRDS